MDDHLYAWAQESLAPLGTVTMRRMMGGATLYLDGIVFAILDDGDIWLKSDAESDAVWDGEGCERFCFTMSDGRTGTLNHRRAPPDVHDDPEAMQRWAALALGAGRRAAAKKKPKGKRRAGAKPSSRRRPGSQDEKSQA